MGTKLHEVLAAEKTPTGAWNQLMEDTLRKFKNSVNFFDGHRKTLKMLEESPQNAATEAAAIEHKPVVTNVAETLQYALGIYGKAEDLQFQKNATNRVAVATVMWKGQPLLPDMPVDQLLGLEARLVQIRTLYAQVPTLDAGIDWVADEQKGQYAFRSKEILTTTKTEKEVVPIVMSPATDKHPAQIQAVGRDKIVGKYEVLKFSGAATSQQKADAIQLVDDLIVEVKQARMRANETEVVRGSVAEKLVPLLLSPFQHKKG